LARDRHFQPLKAKPTANDRSRPRHHWTPGVILPEEALRLTTVRVPRRQFAAALVESLPPVVRVIVSGPCGKSWPCALQDARDFCIDRKTLPAVRPSGRKPAHGDLGMDGREASGARAVRTRVERLKLAGT